MCGVPAHRCDTYVSRLIRQGHRVAICEQIEDSTTKQTKGPLERGVIRVITPGTLTEESLLEASHNNFLTSLVPGKNNILGVASLSKSCEDGKLVSTVEFKINYLAPARLGDILVGEGKVIQKGNRLIIAEGDIKIQGSDKFIAKGLGTFSAYPIEKSGILEHLNPEQKEILGVEYFPDL